MFKVGAAPFINGRSNFKLKVGAALFINGASLKLEPNTYTPLSTFDRQSYKVPAFYQQNPLFYDKSTGHNKDKEHRHKKHKKDKKDKKHPKDKRN